ncbi:MAG: ribonuclease III domain-containing protein [Candidatus Hodarchaeota archaeon]
MEKSFLSYLQGLFESDFFYNKYLQEAFSQNENKNLAEIGDSVLNLVIRMNEYSKHYATPDSIDEARQIYASKKALQRVLNQDVEFTEFLIHNYKCTSPPGKIGLERSDDFMEAIIGAIYLSKDMKAVSKFIITFLDIQ